MNEVPPYSRVKDAHRPDTMGRGKSVFFQEGALDRFQNPCSWARCGGASPIRESPTSWNPPRTLGIGLR